MVYNICKIKLVAIICTCLVATANIGQELRLDANFGFSDLLMVEKLDKPQGKLLELEKHLGLSLFRSNYGLVASKSIESATLIASEWYRSYSLFKETFRKDAGPGIVIDNFKLSNEAQQTIQDLGIKWSLVWPMSFIFKSELASQKIKKIDDPNSHNNAIAHELGHLFLINAFNWIGMPDGYGSPAPDWFDEAIAIYSENEFSTKRRREDFALTDKYELSALITMPHPGTNLNNDIADQVRDLRAKNSGNAMVAMKVESKDKKSQSEVSKFYANVRGFLDFLDASGEGDEILRSLAIGFSKGESFESWLRTNHRRYSLEADIANLEKEWKRFHSRN